jgi:hypothetical protein
MCPFCLAATITAIIAGAASTSGVAALAVKIHRSKKQSRRPHTREIQP